MAMSTGDAEDLDLPKMLFRGVQKSARICNFPTGRSLVVINSTHLKTSLAIWQIAGSILTQHDQISVV